MDQGLSETANLQKEFNINTYAPTMLVFKENIDKPADIIQVHHRAPLPVHALIYAQQCSPRRCLTPFFYAITLVLSRLKE